MNRRTLFFLPVALAAAACTSAGANHARAAGPTPTPPAVKKTPLPDGRVAPLIQSSQWINTKPLAWNSLRGKVVMVEFWTYG